MEAAKAKREPREAQRPCLSQRPRDVILSGLWFLISKNKTVKLKIHRGESKTFINKRGSLSDSKSKGDMIKTKLFRLESATVRSLSLIVLVVLKACRRK